MAYKDCPCVNCDHKADGEKRVACRKKCTEFTAWKVNEQELRRKEKESHPYYSETRQKIIRKHQLKRKGGRRI